MRKSIRGFTLLELIVVIAIIGIISVIIIPSFRNALARSRDAQRRLDISNIQKMLDLYALNNNSMPDNSFPYPSTYGRGNNSLSFWDTQWDLSSNTTATTSFMKFLVDSGITSKVPVDPSNTPNPSNGYPSDDGYRYFYRSHIVYWDVSLGRYIYVPGYMIGIVRFENPANNVQTFIDCPPKINANNVYDRLIYVVCGKVR